MAHTLALAHTLACVLPVPYAVAIAIKMLSTGAASNGITELCLHCRLLPSDVNHAM